MTTAPRSTKDILPTLAALAATSAPFSPEVIAKALGVANSSLAELVLASDAAAKLLEAAAEELKRRTATCSRGGDQTPTLLGNSSVGIVQAVLSEGRLRARVSELEQRVRVVVSPRTRSGVRLKTIRGQEGRIALNDMRPDHEHLSQAVRFLEREGFTIERVGRFGVTASAPAKLVSELLRTPLAVAALKSPATDRAVRAFSQRLAQPGPDDLFVAPLQSISVVGSEICVSVDDFVFVPPPTPSVSAHPPSVSYPFLDRTQVRQILGLDAMHLDGSGVQVGIVDTGFFVDHPAFAERGFDFKAVDATEDQVGHGTSMAWNLLSVAPGSRLRGYVKDDASGAIERAADDGARVISCSWGWPDEQTFSILQLSIRSVIEEDGVAVLFASGNGDRFWPASHPLVIAVGGVYADPADRALQASNFASGFRSDVYPDRNVPDVSGLCGLAPRGIYLPLPVPPASLKDVSHHGFSFPDKDETGIDDGWIYDSGTSSATAQVAGVAALLVQSATNDGRDLTPAQIKQCLQASCTAVTNGRNAFGVPAAGQPNVAVGWGLVNAQAALHALTTL